MCGIGGMYSKEGLNEEQVHDLIAMAIRGECRGRDATGFMNDNHWWKIPKTSSLAVEESGFADWLETAGVWSGKQWLMFHTRNKSQGSEFDSVNNHPLIHRHSWLMHNGRVHAPKYFGELVVDSRNLGYLIDWGVDHGRELVNAVRSTNRSFEGRASLIVSKGREFLVTRNDDPFDKSTVHYLWNKKLDMLQFGSTKSIVGESSIGTIGRKQEYHDVVAYDMKPHQLLHFDGNTKLRRIWHEETHSSDTLIRTRLPRPIRLNKEPLWDLYAEEELRLYK